MSVFIRSGSHLRPLGLCVALLSLSACGADDDWRKPLREAALERDRVEAEEQARLAAIEAELEREQYLANVAPIENDRGEPPRLLSAEEFETLLGHYCGDCHGLDNYEVGFRFETVEDMLRVQKVIPGDAASSRIVMRMQAGEMPPIRSGRAPVPPGTIELIVDFIDSLPPMPPED